MRSPGQLLYCGALIGRQSPLSLSRNEVIVYRAKGIVTPLEQQKFTSHLLQRRVGW